MAVSRRRQWSSSSGLWRAAPGFFQARPWGTERWPGGSGVWGWALGTVALAGALTSIPYVYGARLAGDGYHFSGVVAWHGDVFFYLAQMRLFRTALLIPNPMTPEPHAPVMLNGLLGPVAWIAQWTGLAPEFLYLHVLRIASLAAVAVAVLALGSVAGLSRRARVVALLLAMFGAGWRWLVWLAPPGWPLHDLPYWRKIHAGSTLQQAMTVPHLTLAGALVCGVLYWFLIGCRTGRRRAFLAAGLALSYLTSFHPFEFVPLWATLGLLGLILLLRAPYVQSVLQGSVGIAGIAATSWRLAEGVLWLVGLPLPFLLFYAVRVRASPVFQSVSQQMVSPPTETVFLLVYYGPLLLIACMAPLFSTRDGAGPRAARATLLGWIALVLLLDAVPIVPSQTHFQVGLQLVCAVLASWVLVDAWPAMRQTMGQTMRRRRPVLLAPAAILLLSAPALPLYLQQIVEDLQLRAPAFYLTSDERAALTWIEAAEAAAPAPSVVLADSNDFHMYVARYTAARPVRGQSQQTANVREKESLVRRFFSAEALPEDRRAVARQLDVRFVVVSNTQPAVRTSIETLWPSRFKQGPITIHDVHAER